MEDARHPRARERARHARPVAVGAEEVVVRPVPGVARERAELA